MMAFYWMKMNLVGWLLICSNWSDRINIDWVGESPDEKDDTELQMDVKESF